MIDGHLQARGAMLSAELGGWSIAPEGLRRVFSARSEQGEAQNAVVDHAYIDWCLSGPRCHGAVQIAA